jgi:hypothetical protein
MDKLRLERQVRNCELMDAQYSRRVDGRYVCTLLNANDCFMCAFAEKKVFFKNNETYKMLCLKNE